jgi:hypothetical protein
MVAYFMITMKYDLNYDLQFCDGQHPDRTWAMLHVRSTCGTHTPHAHRLQMVQGHFDDRILDPAADDAREASVVNTEMRLLDNQGTSAEQNDEFRAAVEQVRAGCSVLVDRHLKQALVRNAPMQEVELNELSESGAYTRAPRRTNRICRFTDDFDAGKKSRRRCGRVR